MKRNLKIMLGVIITSSIVIVGFIGVLTINHFLRNNIQDYDDTPPLLLFPVENITRLEYLYGYNMTDPELNHNGIDFIINETVNIIASCNFTVNDKGLADINAAGFWQAGFSATVNDAYEIFYAFENFSNDTEAGNQQFAAITVEVGQQIVAGDIVGQLLYLSPFTHIHYMLQKSGEPVCPYAHFTPEAKTTFDTLWLEIGSAGEPCNTTLSY
jgi:hypothetical protein